MAKTQAIYMRVEPETKRQVDNILSQLGMTTAEAMNIFLKQIILNDGLPFSVQIPNAETKIAIENVRNRVGLSKSFSSVKELMEDLDADY